MTDDIGYDALTQAAMRGILREVLKRTAETGFVPGDHNFWITFRTRAPGVEIADSLIAQHPEDMTIVLQHQFRDLEVSHEHFEVVLKFSGVPQHLSIPFSAVRQFYDKSVKFGLAFKDPEKGEVVALDLSSETDEAADVEAEADRVEGEGATVLSIDQFRKR